ncbi:unnamed protein product [Plutella xylostella]|uniref:(diamondback moth) hypothetical protein n=1 Tax=Plutella xylostella TaxID=51655 RepID=A0A8S4F586_PLUXY|nr:unnamed protein product [Plutella xylostella]
MTLNLKAKIKAKQFKAKVNKKVCVHLHHTRITSITTLTVLSFERYMMVTRPLSSRHLSSKGAILSIMFIWSYSLALTTPPLLGWGNYVNEAANIRYVGNITTLPSNDKVRVKIASNYFKTEKMKPFAILI